MTPQAAGVLVVGQVIRPHGITGELVVEIRTDSPEQRFAAGVVLGVQAPKRRPQAAASAPLPAQLTIQSSRAHSGRLLVRAEGVEGREAAEALRGVLLTVSVTELEPTADPEEFHDHELEGLQVVLTDGEVVGKVAGVAHNPAGDLLEVARSDASGDNAATALVPFVSAIVVRVDLEQRQIVLDPPEGLL